MRLLDMLDQSSQFVASITKKLSAPLVTLLSSEPEIQFVSLRNISLVIQKRSVVILDVEGTYMYIWVVWHV